MKRIVLFGAANPALAPVLAAELALASASANRLAGAGRVAALRRA